MVTGRAVAGMVLAALVGGLSALGLLALPYGDDDSVLLGLSGVVGLPVAVLAGYLLMVRDEWLLPVSERYRAVRHLLLVLTGCWLLGAALLGLSELDDTVASSATAGDRLLDHGPTAVVFFAMAGASVVAWWLTAPRQYGGRL